MELVSRKARRSAGEKWSGQLVMKRRDPRQALRLEPLTATESRRVSGLLAIESGTMSTLNVVKYEAAFWAIRQSLSHR